MINQGAKKTYWWGAVECTTLSYLVCLVFAEPSADPTFSCLRMLALLGGATGGLGFVYLILRSSVMRSDSILHAYDLCITVSVVLFILWFLYLAGIIELGLISQAVVFGIGFCASLIFIHSQSIMVKLSALNLIKTDLISFVCGSGAATLSLLVGISYLFIPICLAIVIVAVASSISRERFKSVLVHSSARQKGMSSVRVLAIPNAFYGVLIGLMLYATYRLYEQMNRIYLPVAAVFVAAAISFLFFMPRANENFLAVPRGLYTYIAALVFVSGCYFGSTSFAMISLIFIFLLMIRTFCVLYLTILQVKRRSLSCAQALAWSFIPLFVFPIITFLFISAIFTLIPFACTTEFMFFLCCITVASQTFVFSQVAEGRTASGDIIASISTNSETLKSIARDDAFAEISLKYDLSTREQEVFEYLSKGRTAKYIGEKLNISYSTVKSHINRIYAKTGIHSQQELLDLVENVYKQHIYMMR